MYYYDTLTLPKMPKHTCLICDVPMTFRGVHCDRWECVAKGMELIEAEKANRAASMPTMPLTRPKPIAVNLGDSKRTRETPYNRRHPRRKGFWG